MSDVRLVVLDQLDQLEEVFLEGTRIPFSGGRLVNEHDAVELLDAIRDALPREIEIAVELVKKRDEFINTAKKQAAEILEQANRQHDHLVSTATVRQDAERQVHDLREQTRQQCESLLQSSRQKCAVLEQELQNKLTQQEQQFVMRRQQLEQDTNQRKQQLEHELLEFQQKQAEQHKINQRNALQELETVRAEGQRLLKDSQAKAEKLQTEAATTKLQTQQQCESLIQRSRQEAFEVQDGANRYAEQTLSELESRLKEMAKVVIAGRQELLKLQSSSTASAPTTPSQAKTVPINRARQSGSDLRSMRSTG